MDMAVEDKNSAQEEGKNPEEEEEGKNPAEKIAICASTLDGQEVQQLGSAERTHESVDGEEPPNRGGAKRTEEPVCAEDAAIMGVTKKSQEPVDAQEPHLPGGAEQKQKRVELKKIKKEKQLGGVENKGMRVELKKIKKEQQLGGVAKKRKRVELKKKEKQSSGTDKNNCIARDVLAIQASTVASESSFSAGGRIISDHRTRLKSDTIEGLICLQGWLKAAEPKPTNKDVEEEEYLVFYQSSKCQEEGCACSQSSAPSSSQLSSPHPRHPMSTRSPRSSGSPLPSTSTAKDPP